MSTSIEERFWVNETFLSQRPLQYPLVTRNLVRQPFLLRLFNGRQQRVTSTPRLKRKERPSPVDDPFDLGVRSPTGSLPFGSTRRHDSSFRWEHHRPRKRSGVSGPSVYLCSVLFLHVMVTYSYRWRRGESGYDCITVVILFHNGNDCNIIFHMYQ